MQYVVFEYDIITKAGLTIPEAATITGVSSVIMWRYVNGSAEPRAGKYKGKDLRLSVATMLLVLTKLVEKGALPKLDLEFARKLHPEKKAKRTALVNKIRAIVAERVALSLANE